MKREMRRELRKHAQEMRRELRKHAQERSNALLSLEASMMDKVRNCREELREAIAEEGIQRAQLEALESEMQAPGRLPSFPPGPRPPGPRPGVGGNTENAPNPPRSKGGRPPGPGRGRVGRPPWKHLVARLPGPIANSGGPGRGH